MKKVIINGDTDTIKLYVLEDYVPIFAKKAGMWVGMVIKDRDHGWIVRLGGTAGANGHFKTRKDCLLAAEQSGYTFYTDL